MPFYGIFIKFEWITHEQQQNQIRIDWIPRIRFVTLAQPMVHAHEIDIEHCVSKRMWNNKNGSLHQPEQQLLSRRIWQFILTEAMRTNQNWRNNVRLHNFRCFHWTLKLFILLNKISTIIILALFEPKENICVPLLGNR